MKLPGTHLIAVGVDFSDKGAVAIDHAARLALQTGSKLLLLHVGPNLGPVLGPAGSLSVEAIRRDFLIEAEKGLIAEQKKLREAHPDLEISVRRVDGRPDYDLATTAHTAGADLLVIGTHGRTGLTRFLMGSVAERTARESHIDVLVARGEDSVPPYRHVLVAYDFSDQGRRALDRAIELAPDDGTIRVIHAVDNAIPTPPEGAPTASVALFEEIFSAAERKLRDELEGWRERFPELEGDCVHGPASRAIQDELDQRDYDLLCIGSHGRTGVKRWLLGSVAETTVRHSSVPVLVAKESA